MDLPSLSHWANVNGFMVEPGWNPPRPLRSLPLASRASTLKFCSAELAVGGSHTVFWAMLMILPVFGWTDTMDAPHLSGFAPAAPSTCCLRRVLGVRVKGGL